jgi:hypothetical protein
MMVTRDAIIVVYDADAADGPIIEHFSRKNTIYIFLYSGKIGSHESDLGRKEDLRRLRQHEGIHLSLSG